MEWNTLIQKDVVQPARRVVVFFDLTAKQAARYTAQCSV